MKCITRTLAVGLGLLCTVGTASEMDFYALKTFSVIGTHIDKKASAFAAYRLHDDDPVFFQTGLRLTCRCGEEFDGKKFHDPPATKYTTYTWVYEW